MLLTSHLSKVYKAGWGNLTDLYQLTMANGYWQSKVHEKKVAFHLFFRKHPFKGDFTVAAGLALVADYLQNWSFSVQEVQYLGALKGVDGKPLFGEPFLHYLQRLRFTGDVYAVPEGTIIHPHEPVIRIEATLIQAQLIETALLNLVNFSSLIATKAARMRRVVGKDDMLLEFGLRRAQGIDGALTASRSAYIGGCDASSNVWAGQYLGIPIKGTHAHSWVMVFEDELEAFRQYATAMPNNCTFLVDTYDTLRGVERAIEVGKELKEQGHRLLGVRLDSGDMANLSKRARQLLDDAGFKDTAIVASNDLDEHRLAQMKADEADINVWGIGTRLVTGGEQSALGGVYKLAAIEDNKGEWQARIKLSEQEVKISNPGRQQVIRFIDAFGGAAGDMIYHLDDEEKGRSIQPYNRASVVDFPDNMQSVKLLKEIFKSGDVCYDFPSLTAIRTKCIDEVDAFEKRAEKPYIYGLSPGLVSLKERLIEQQKTN